MWVSEMETGTACLIVPKVGASSASNCHSLLSAAVAGRAIRFEIQVFPLQRCLMDDARVYHGFDCFFVHTIRRHFFECWLPFLTQAGLIILPGEHLFHLMTLPILI